MGTFGKILLPEYVIYTIERPWLNNKPYISCIPPGEYKAELSHYYRGGYDTFEIKNVPERSLIKFHKASFATDVQGCVGLGLRIGAVDNRWGVFDCDEAMSAFMKILTDIQEMTVKIRYVY